MDEGLEVDCWEGAILEIQGGGVVGVKLARCDCDSGEKLGAHKTFESDGVVAVEMVGLFKGAVYLVHLLAEWARVCVSLA